MPFVNPKEITTSSTETCYVNCDMRKKKKMFKKKKTNTRKIIYTNTKRAIRENFICMVIMEAGRG
jgi:hypothetical protein